MDRPIPAFYACYLLRSTVRHQSLYVGSTPNPVRRRRQHNGEAKGGAVRTSRDSLRPWEMTCLVTGFPSKIAALQFEWAWQNTHLTRHIAADERLTQAKSTTRFSPKTGRIRKRSARPRLCLTDRLGNLHLLLRSSSFERWPLKVTFYAPDVFRVWEKWQRQHLETLRPGVEVKLDEPISEAVVESGADFRAASGIHKLDVGYSGVKPHLEKSRSLLEDGEWLQCAICRKELPTSGAGTLGCTTEGCNTLTHVECLSAAFLEAEGEADALLPTSGSCPGCDIELHWIDLVKELSLRMRGGEAVEALFKKRRRGKGTAKAVMADSASEASDGEGALDRLVPDEDDDWHELSDENLEEVVVRSDPTPAVKRPKSAAFKKAAAAPPHSEPVIEESDWDDAEVIS